MLDDKNRVTMFSLDMVIDIQFDFAEPQSVRAVHGEMVFAVGGDIEIDGGGEIPNARTTGEG